MFMMLTGCDHTGTSGLPLSYRHFTGLCMKLTRCDHTDTMHGLISTVGNEMPRIRPKLCMLLVLQRLWLLRPRCNHTDTTGKLITCVENMMQKHGLPGGCKHGRR
jgi:hypothetical protein